jgi:beta-galactosidase
MTSQLRSFEEVSIDDDRSTALTFLSVSFMSPPVLDWGWEVRTTYSLFYGGRIVIDVGLKPTGFMPDHVPRVGLDLRVNKHFQSASWYGLGPGEAYPDTKSAQRTGIWAKESIAELETHYDVPQEAGNRMGTRWLTLTSPTGAGLRVFSNSPFHWQASRYSPATVEAARHPCDLVGKEEDSTLLRLDHRVAGVGSAACGPGPREDMLVRPREMGFRFVLEKVQL